MNRPSQSARWLCAPIFAALVSCGGGTDGTGATPPPSAPITSSGAMTKGSVILNGIHFDDSKAIVRDDRNRSSAQLANGMVVKLRGRSDDGLTGLADGIAVKSEARAVIQSIDAGASPQRFVTGGLIVLVDSQTVYANVAGFAALAVGQRVEVHGLRDDLGDLHATRVEAVGVADGPDELRGAVAGLNTALHQLTLNGTVTVNYAGATFVPPGTNESALGVGVIVEVRGSISGNVFTAAQVVIEDLEDADFGGNPEEKQEVEGFVSGFSAHPGTLQVNGRTVQTTSATQFANGSAADLANNVEVEAEGTINSAGLLVATKVEFERARVLLQGLATAVDPTARTVIVLGQTVQANDLTRIDARVGGGGGGGGNSTSLADITAGVDCVEVRAITSGATIVAEEIKEPSGCGKDLVQATVAGANATTFTLTFFAGLNAALGGAGVGFRDANEQSITRAAFFAAVVPAGNGSAGTPVKVKGVLTAGVLVAEEVELEN